MAYDDTNKHNVGGSVFNSAHASGAIVIGALVALVLIRRGFRGVSVAGVSVGIK